MLSATVVNEMIRSWKRARLSKDMTAMGYPSISVIGKCVDMGADTVAAARGQHVPPIHDDALTDADRVQNLVQQMPAEMKKVFEAYHLALINGKNVRKARHKDRARHLDMPYSTYKYRVNAGWAFIQCWLPENLQYKR